MKSNHPTENREISLSKRIPHSLAKQPYLATVQLSHSSLCCNKWLLYSKNPPFPGFLGHLEDHHPPQKKPGSLCFDRSSYLFPRDREIIPSLLRTHCVSLQTQPHPFCAGKRAGKRHAGSSPDARRLTWQLTASQ